MNKLIIALFFVISLRADITVGQVVAAIEDAEVYTIMATGSMKPTFDETYVAIVKPTLWKELKVGDIILFYADVNGVIKIVVHRIWSRSSAGSIVLTKGDACGAPDPWEVKEANYVGHLVGVIRRDVL